MDINLPEVIAELTEKRANETRQEWLQRTEALCDKWGPIVLLWTQDEVYRQAENARHLASALENLLETPRDPAAWEIARKALGAHKYIVFSERPPYNPPATSTASQSPEPEPANPQPSASPEEPHP